MKKGEVSNGVVAALVVAALVVSVVGTYIISSKFNQLSGGYAPITGFAVNETTGYVNLTIAQVLSFNLTDNLIEFGSGSIVPGSPSASCDSDAGTGTNTSFSNGVCANNRDVMSLWNDGNVQIDITVNSTHTADEFFCAGASALCNGSQSLKYKTVDPNAQCSDGKQTSYTDLTHDHQTFCLGLNATGSSANYVELASKIDFNTYVATGTHTATLTFKAVKSS